MAALMIQGCGSDVGKTVLVAGLCRLFANRGLRVLPFKPQNMSNNAAVTADGGEIGRAQALQALACRVAPSVDMNPVLLKPQSDVGAQLIVGGKMAGTWKADGYQAHKATLLPRVLESYHRLTATADLVLIEGAGSPAEINLRTADIANMGFAQAAGVPVVLVGDIDRGHVIAALVGAQAVLAEADSALIKGFIINKFRGDPTLFSEGRRQIAERTGWRDFGMVPWLPDAARLPAEDAVGLERASARTRADRPRRIVALQVSRLANFDEFDPLHADPSLDFSFLAPGTALPGDVDVVIIPGTKATLADLAFLRAQGWDIDVAAHVRRGGRVLGICGGYQMLGRHVADLDGVEGLPAMDSGLGLLDVETTLTGTKVLRPVSGTLAADGVSIQGYEMHVGRTAGPDTVRPLLHLDGVGPDGACSADGRIAGCYVHGLFAKPRARQALLGGDGAGDDHGTKVDSALDALADALESALDMRGLADLAGLPSGFFK